MLASQEGYDFAGDIYDVTPEALDAACASLGWALDLRAGGELVHRDGQVDVSFLPSRARDRREYLFNARVFGGLDDARAVARRLGAALAGAGLSYDFELEDENGAPEHIRSPRP